MKMKYFFLITIVLVSCAGTPSKGDLYLDLSMPYVNNFLIQPEIEDEKNFTRFNGFGVGLDYYYSNNQFIDLKVLFAISNLFPFPFVYEPSFEGEEEFINSIYMCFSHNHRIRRFAFGYGISFSENFWKHHNYDTKISISKEYSTIGFYFPVYFYFTNFFSIGTVYKPTFYRPNMKNKFQYEHLISLDLDFKIHLNKRSQNRKKTLN
jgi:hypothetical protein